LQLKYHGRPIEYIPIAVGFGTTEFCDGQIFRNGKSVKISAAATGFAAPTAAETDKRLRELKKRGVNTLYTQHPMPYWFYDLCDRRGLYVIDRAAVNVDAKGDNRGLEGTAANKPELVKRFVERVQSTYFRNKNHPSVIGWSISSEAGNGYNLYKSYQWMKGADSTRAVIYPRARGEWNSDMELPQPVNETARQNIEEAKQLGVNKGKLGYTVTK
jgi:beta-galactosidase